MSGIPDKKTREVCWKARDTYFECLATNGDDQVSYLAPPFGCQLIQDANTWWISGP